MLKKFLYKEFVCTQLLPFHHSPVVSSARCIFPETWQDSERPETVPNKVADSVTDLSSRGFVFWYYFVESTSEIDLGSSFSLIRMRTVNMNQGSILEASLFRKKIHSVKSSVFVFI